MNVPDIASALTPASGATRRNSSGTSTVEPGGTLTLICSAGPGDRKPSVTTADSTPGLASTRPGFEGSPATAGRTIHDDAGRAPVTDAWSETTPNVRRTTATSCPDTVRRTEVGPEVVDAKVRADSAGMLASARPANTCGGPPWTRMSPLSETRAPSLPAPALITTSWVRPASAPPGKVSVRGGVPRYPTADLIPPVSETPSVAAATRPTETSTSAETVGSPRTTSPRSNAALRKGRRATSVSEPCRTGSLRSDSRVIEKTASRANGFITTT